MIKMDMRPYRQSNSIIGFMMCIHICLPTTFHNHLVVYFFSLPQTEALRPKETSLTSRIEEMQSRVSYAASHEEQIRDKLVVLCNDSDYLLKQRRKFRSGM